MASNHKLVNSSLSECTPSSIKDAVQTEAEEVAALQRSVQVAVCHICRDVGQHQHRVHVVFGEQGAGLSGRGVSEAEPEPAQVLWAAVYESTPRGQSFMLVGTGQTD